MNLWPMLVTPMGRFHKWSFIDGSSVGIDSSEPFVLDTSLPQGVYDLTATATDNDGYSTSTTVKKLYILADTLPSVLRFNVEPSDHNTPDGFIKLDDKSLAFHGGYYFGWSNKTPSDDKLLEWNSGDASFGSYPDEAHDTYTDLSRYASFEVHTQW